METEKRADRLSVEDFKSKVSGIAKILGYKVRKMEEETYRYDNCARLDGPNNGEIWIRNGGYGNANRFSISGCLPRSYYGRDMFSNITATETKSAATIAGDITKRFMPAYLVALEKSNAWAAKEDADAASRKAALETVKGWEASKDELERKEVYMYMGPEEENNRVRVEFKADYDGILGKLEIDNIEPKIAAEIVD